MFSSWLEVLGTLWFVAVVVILVWVLWPARRSRALSADRSGKPRSTPFDAGGGNAGSSNVHLGVGAHGDGSGA